MTDIEASTGFREPSDDEAAWRHRRIADDDPVFSAELFPHRSLGRKGFRVLMLVAGAGFLPNALYFAVAGAWPIAVSCLIAFAMLYGAFRLSYRSARSREYVSVSRQTVRVIKVSPSGKVSDVRFNPLWTRFSVDRHDTFGITGMWLESRHRQLAIGAFLNPDDRESFAEAFRLALATVKQRI